MEEPSETSQRIRQDAWDTVPKLRNADALLHYTMPPPCLPPSPNRRRSQKHRRRKQDSGMRVDWLSSKNGTAPSTGLHYPLGGADADADVGCKLGWMSDGPPHQ